MPKKEDAHELRRGNLGESALHPKAEHDRNHHFHLVFRHRTGGPGRESVHFIRAHGVQAGYPHIPVRRGHQTGPVRPVLRRPGRGDPGGGGENPVPKTRGPLPFSARHRGIHLRTLRGGQLQQAGPRRRPGGGRAPGGELQPPLHPRGVRPGQNPFALRHCPHHP